MLCKLAWGNVRRAGRDYLVYLLTLTLGVTVFYAFNTISMQVDIAGIDEEGLAQVMGSMLGDLTYFLAGVMAFLMVYANNFIMKRRKKEFGLYQVLGMGRGRVATIMALETVIVSVGAFVAGIVLGVGLSQLMTFFTASLFKTQIANFHFFFSVHAFNLTLACMLVMFVLTLLLNLHAVRRTKLIELMGAERRNESIKTRNPWIAIAIFAVGVALVGVAYYRLLRDGFPLTATDSKLQEAMTQFGITTAMVTVGTFALFWGLSGMLIKLLQSLRGVYWRGLNMFTVRQLAAKVNTVCFSMGVIAMLLFLAITSVTCGMSIANVMNENLERYNPVDVSQTYVYYTPDTLDYYKEYVNPSEADRMVLADTTVDLYSAWHGKGKSADNNDETGKKVNIADVAGEHVQIDSYLSYPLGGSGPSVVAGEMCKAMGEKLPKALEGSNADDAGDYRPGTRAVRELDVRSPLMETGWCKDEERALLRSWGFDVWDLPAGACLATRIPCGEALTAEKLHTVRMCEDYLHGLGLRQVRVRIDGGMARVSVGAGESAGAIAEAGSHAGAHPHADSKPGRLSPAVIQELQARGCAAVDPVVHPYRHGEGNGAA